MKGMQAMSALAENTSGSSILSEGMAWGKMLNVLAEPSLGTFTWSEEEEEGW